jgi:hypothetical protein
MRSWTYLIGAMWVGVCMRLASAEEIPLTTQQLLTDCREAVHGIRGEPVSGLYDTAFCLGYFFGYQAVPKPVTYCVPPEVTIGQEVVVFVRWADQHPERWYLTQYKAVTEAFQEAWPCKP